MNFISKIIIVLEYSKSNKLHLDNICRNTYTSASIFIVRHYIMTYTMYQILESHTEAWF